MMKKYIYVTLQQEMIHHYKDAPDEVAYLRYPHRHLLFITVQVEVFDNDREIEFIMFKHWLQKTIFPSYDFIDQENSSCEMIAERIIHEVQAEYGNRDMRVTVSEDNENGAILEYRGDNDV